MEENESKPRALNETIGSRENRSPNDFYRTPTFAIKALLVREKFPGVVYDPAAGDGRITKQLFEYCGEDRVVAMDLIDRGFRLDAVADFLGFEKEDFEHKGEFSIVTNPPYEDATEFVLQAENVGASKAAFLLRTNFLEGEKRFLKLFKSQSRGLSNFGLKQIYQFSKRISCEEVPAGKKAQAKISFAWFVWERGYLDLPMLDWIPPFECQGEI